MSVIQFSCPYCDAMAETEASFAGQEVACPTCGAALIVPGDGESDDLSSAPVPPEFSGFSRPVSHSATGPTPPPFAETGGKSGVQREPARRPAPSGIQKTGVTIDPTSAATRRVERMTPEERERVRFRNNVIVLAICTSILLGLLGALLYQNSQVRAKPALNPAVGPAPVAS